MLPAAPIVQPQPIATVVAPAPAPKQPRGNQPVKTLTREAVDSPQKAENGSAASRQRQRGLELDIQA